MSNTEQSSELPPETTATVVINTPTGPSWGLLISLVLISSAASAIAFYQLGKNVEGVEHMEAMVDQGIAEYYQDNRFKRHWRYIDKCKGQEHVPDGYRLYEQFNTNGVVSYSIRKREDPRNFIYYYNTFTNLQH